MCCGNVFAQDVSVCVCVCVWFRVRLFVSFQFTSNIFPFQRPDIIRGQKKEMKNNTNTLSGTQNISSGHFMYVILLY